MPAPALKAMARKYGVPLDRAEAFWRQARKQYGDDFEAVMGTVRKMCRNYAKKGGGARTKGRGLPPSRSGMELARR